MDNDLKTTPYFTHLHVHTHYSILDGMSSIPDLVEKCLRNGMEALAITDHGTMYGIKEFFDYVDKKNSKLKESGENPFKPIFGCEVYVARQTTTNPSGSRFVKDHKENRSGYHLILLAKNEQGYHNLCKMVSAAWIDGHYYSPRIDRSLLEEYHEGIIACSACLAGEVPRALASGDYEKAKAAALWYKQLFGEDYYLEMQRHPTDKPGGDREVFEQQKPVNEGLLRLSAETGIKIICTNDVHFVEEEHGEAHDRLICLSTGKKWSDTERLHYTKQEWLKTPDEMAALFADVPEALANTKEIVDKVEFFPLKHAPIMPVFDIPESFGTVEGYREKFTEEDLKAEFEADGVGRIAKLGGLDRVYRIKLEADYLRKLTLDGARIRYGDPVPDDVMERIDFELGVMRNMGFPGYFLIVQDFISAARGMGVSVGPGRGSAAGSVVAYCLKITDVDPLKYDLLFERFLNPDRISLPDIDVDFDDDGRYKVLNWVTGKYGKERVAHIITYGTMAAKSSIKDVARVQDLDLATSNSLANMIPSDLPEDPKTHKPMKVNIKNCISAVPEMKSAYDRDPKIREVLTYASQLEGTVRQTGVHACGVIIGADDLTNFAPLSTIKDKDSGEEVLVTQYEGSVVEDVGLIKMDFLGLKTLSIIKDTLENVRKSRGETVDIDHIPMDDEATYRLFCDGNTIATFQFESPGMQKYLRELRPTKFEDLIAMNALYRPGPMDYIPQFINRKHGREQIAYDIPEMEKYLKDTYGITVYQEQVMLLSRLLADFTRGESDTLRKAMGKKQIAKMMELKDKFMRQGEANGHDPKVLEKIWADWEKFASYAFNKSHATCYSWIAYQTAYLKAHYPAEFMAANLTRNQNNIKEITVLMAECKRMKIPVLGPDVNESDLQFTVNSKGEIRFGLAALKGVGEAASESVVAERRKNGNYTSVMDFLQRVNLRTCNRKCVESLGLAGTFESLDDLRCELFENSDFLERIMRFAARYQERKASIQTSLFGDETVSVEESGMEVPEVQPWSVMQRLQHEKEICGYYVSGHPMDKYRLESRMFSCCTVSELKAIAAESKASKVTHYLAGMLVQADCLTSQKGNEYAKVVIRDYEEEMTLFVFGEVFLKYRHLLQPDYQVLMAMQGEVRQDRFSWRVMEVHPLETVMEKFAKRIRLSIPVSRIDAGLSEKLEHLCEEFSDEHKVDLDICVTSGDSQTDVTLTMRKGLDVASFCQQLQSDYPDFPLSVSR